MSTTSFMFSSFLGAVLAAGTSCTTQSKAGPDERPAARSLAQENWTNQEGTIAMSVTSEGFVPAEITVKAGESVRLVVTRKTERTCATDIVIKDFGINKPLPLNQPVEVDFTPTQPGRVRYACAMDMIAGVLIVL
jgi:plastocyanin domain-containing protein